MTGLGDWFLFLIILTAFGSVAYLIGLERGRHQGWDDARDLRGGDPEGV